jgi:hypothetical protein
MSHTTGLKLETEQEHELGIVICKICNNVIATIPTNGIKKIYGVCKDISCGQQSKGGAKQ